MSSSPSVLVIYFGFQPELEFLGVTAIRNLGHRQAINFIGEKGYSITKQQVINNGQGPLVNTYGKYV